MYSIALKNFLLKNKLNSNTINNFYKFKSNHFDSMNVLKPKKKSIFEQTQMNPYHLPPRKKTNRVKQDKFSDENYTWERLPSPVKESSKALISVLEKEELAKIKAAGLKKDPINLGDKIEVEYYHSITSKKLYKYKGVVISIKRPNSLSFSFKFLTQVAGSFVMIEYPYYSPMLNSIKVIFRSDVNRRNKIYNIRKIKDFGDRLDEIMKGGKKVNINKKTTKTLRKIESQKESIIIE